MHLHKCKGQSVCLCDVCIEGRESIRMPHDNAHMEKHSRSPAPRRNSLVPSHAAVPMTDQVTHNLEVQTMGCLVVPTASFSTAI